jgi:hypothetical protein
MNEDKYHLETIIANMCRVVGADYTSIDTSGEQWYTRYSWDKQTEDRFKNWLADYIHKIPSAQRELYNRSYMRKKDCVDAANMFIFNYGWKNED